MKKLFLIFLLFTIHSSVVQAQSWDALGTGINTAPLSSVSAVDSFGGNIYAGGSFDTAGGIPANNIAEWNGSAWLAMGTGVTCRFNLPNVWSFEVYNGKLYVGGIFDTAGGKPAGNIAEWDGSAWKSLGVGINGAVYAFTIYNGNLIVGGSFSNAGGTPANNIAEWNGTTWSSISVGTNSEITGLAVYGGNLYASGLFDSAGGKPANYIAEWNGVSWIPLGTGTSYWAYKIAAYNGNLYAGGGFTKAGGNPAWYIAQWNGTVWSAVGSGMDNWVLGFQVFNGNLIAGGDFNSAGGSLGTRGIAQWNGTTWSSVGGGRVGAGSFAVLNGSLYAGGNFDSAGGTPANKIAEWCPGSCPAGVNEIPSSKQEVNVYPNPSNGSFNLSIKNYQLGIKYNVEVYNMLGERIYSVDNAQLTVDNGKMLIDLSDKPNGIYLLKISNSNGIVLTSKLSVIH